MREKDKPMMVGVKRISTVVGLLAVTASVALGQGPAANPNQMTADSVANAPAFQPDPGGFPDRDRGPGRTGQPDRHAGEPGPQGRGRGAGPERRGRAGRGRPAPGRRSHHHAGPVPAASRR